jgi:hypothetical protein
MAYAHNGRYVPIVSPTLASVWFHVAHYGLLVAVPVLVLGVVAVAERRHPTHDPDDAQAVERRIAQMRLAYGQMAPARAPAPRAAPRSHAPDDTRQPVGLPEVVLASLSGGAGLIHVAVISLHLREYWLYGVFFAVASALQIAWAYRMLRAPSRKLLVMAVIGNAAVILLWLLSRTSGLPIGPEPGTAEALGWRDGVATSYEAGLVFFGAVLLMKGPLFARRVRERRATVIVLLVLVGAALAAAAGGH